MPSADWPPVALVQRVVYLYLGLNYPVSADWPIADPLLDDLYDYIYNNLGDPRGLAQWIHDHIPPANQPGFVRCWKLAIKQAKAAQTKWENEGRGAGDEGPCGASHPPQVPKSHYPAVTGADYH